MLLQILQMSMRNIFNSFCVRNCPQKSHNITTQCMVCESPERWWVGRIFFLNFPIMTSEILFCQITRNFSWDLLKTSLVILRWQDKWILISYSLIYFLISGMPASLHGILTSASTDSCWKKLRWFCFEMAKTQLTEQCMQWSALMTHMKLFCHDKSSCDLGKTTFVILWYW